MIRGKRLRPLAVLSDRPLELEGYGTIPPITADRAGLSGPMPTTSASSCRRPFPPRCMPRLSAIWRDVIGNSEALKKYATANGAQFAPVAGDDAVKAAMPAIQAYAWLLHDGGKSKVAPDTVGIPRP